MVDERGSGEGVGEVNRWDCSRLDDLLFTYPSTWTAMKGLVLVLERLGERRVLRQSRWLRVSGGE